MSFEDVKARIMGWGAEPSTLAEARASAMGWKVFPGSSRHEAGEVPPAGTPNRIPGANGTLQPQVAASRQLANERYTWDLLTRSGDVIAPPYAPTTLSALVRQSDALPQAIDAMATNIGGHGYELEPLFPVRDPETGEALPTPPAAEKERDEVMLFLASACVGLGLTGLLDLCDRDCETVGWLTFEVLRNQKGHLAGFEHMPAHTTRFGPLSRPILVEIPFRHPVSGELVKIRRYRRFRAVAQIDDHGSVVWFKQFGDPRHLNWQSGQFRAEPWGVDELGNSLEASEVVSRRVYAPETPYGIPRWVGADPHVRAGRLAAELVVDWHANAPIGLKVAMIAGGTWKADSLKELQDTIDDHARGIRDAWQLLGLEGEFAQPDGDGQPSLDDSSGAAPRIGFEDLAWELPTELYHGPESLIDASHKRVRRMFRLPAIFFGDSEAETNRAAAETAKAITEQLVFGPIRQLRWEVLFNHEILPVMGVRYWKLRIRSTPASKAEAVAGILQTVEKGGGASANDLARLYAEVLGVEPTLVHEPWADKPLSMVVAMLAAGDNPNLTVEEIMKAKEERRKEMAAGLDPAGGDGEDDPEDGDGGGGSPPPPPPGGEDDEEEDEDGDVATKVLGQVADHLVALRAQVDRAVAERDASGRLPKAWQQDG